MTRSFILSFFLIVLIQVVFSQPVLFHFSTDFTAKNDFGVNRYVMVSQIEKPLHPLFTEKMPSLLIRPNEQLLLVGKGKNQMGRIDSLIWSEGDFGLCFTQDSVLINSNEAAAAIIFRVATDLSRIHEEGILDESQCKNGLIQLTNTQGQRPKKIMLDLSTNYVNLDYPADTYPLYRHYEWVDVDRDGTGNAFMLTYSDQTTHEAWIQTKKIGDVKLYEKPFQEIFLRSLDGTIIIELTKAEKVRHLNIDYALKGPWKIIYYIEW